jgi:hypothetical protein
MRYLHFVAASGLDRSGVVRRVSVPPISRGGSAVSERLDRHFALLAQQAPARATESDEAVELMRSLTARPKRSSHRFGRLALAAPLRHLRRLIGG